MKKIFLLVVVFCLMISTVAFADTSTEPKVTELTNVESEDGKTGTVGYKIEFKTENEVHDFLSKNNMSASAMTRSYGVYNKSQTYNHTPFTVTISCSWYANGDNSYIMHMYGTYNIIATNYNLSWGASSTNPAQHSLELNYSSTIERGYILYIAQLTSGGSNALLTEYVY